MTRECDFNLYINCNVYLLSIYLSISTTIIVIIIIVILLMSISNLNYREINKEVNIEE